MTGELVGCFEECNNGRKDWFDSNFGVSVDREESEEIVEIFENLLVQCSEL